MGKKEKLGQKVDAILFILVSQFVVSKNFKITFSKNRSRPRMPSFGVSSSPIISSEGHDVPFIWLGGFMYGWFKLIFMAFWNREKSMKHETTIRQVTCVQCCCYCFKKNIYIHISNVGFNCSNTLFMEFVLVFVALVVPQSTCTHINITMLFQTRI